MGGRVWCYRVQNGGRVWVERPRRTSSEGGGASVHTLHVTDRILSLCTLSIGVVSAKKFTNSNTNRHDRRAPLRPLPVSKKIVLQGFSSHFLLCCQACLMHRCVAIHGRNSVGSRSIAPSMFRGASKSEMDATYVTVPRETEGRGYGSTGRLLACCEGGGYG